MYFSFCSFEAVIWVVEWWAWSRWSLWSICTWGTGSIIMIVHELVLRPLRVKNRLTILNLSHSELMLVLHWMALLNRLSIGSVLMMTLLSQLHLLLWSITWIYRMRIKVSLRIRHELMVFRLLWHRLHEVCHRTHRRLEEFFLQRYLFRQSLLLRNLTQL